jgi:hypothetical protein
VNVRPANAAVLYSAGVTFHFWKTLRSQNTRTGLTVRRHTTQAEAARAIPLPLPTAPFCRSNWPSFGPLINLRVVLCGLQDSPTRVGSWSFIREAFNVAAKRNFLASGNKTLRDRFRQ